jgi:hypothetical protein
MQFPLEMNACQHRYYILNIPIYVFAYQFEAAQAAPAIPARNITLSAVRRRSKCTRTSTEAEPARCRPTTRSNHLAWQRQGVIDGTSWSALASPTPLPRLFRQNQYDTDIALQNSRRDDRHVNGKTVRHFGRGLLVLQENIYEIGLGVDRLDHRVRRGRQKPVDQVRAGDRVPPRFRSRCKVKNFTDSTFRA